MPRAGKGETVFANHREREPCGEMLTSAATNSGIAPSLCEDCFSLSRLAQFPDLWRVGWAGEVYCGELLKQLGQSVRDSTAAL
jgi:hypothetical protein